MSKFAQKIQDLTKVVPVVEKPQVDESLVFFESLIAELETCNTKQSFDQKIKELGILSEADTSQGFFAGLADKFNSIVGSSAMKEPSFNKANVYYLKDAKNNLDDLEKVLGIDNKLRLQIEKYDNLISNMISIKNALARQPNILPTFNVQIEPDIKQEIGKLEKLQKELQKYQKNARTNKGLATQLPNHEARIKQEATTIKQNLSIELQQKIDKTKRFLADTKNPFEKSGMITPRTREAFKYRFYKAFETAVRSAQPYFSIDELLYGRIRGEKTKEERTFVSSDKPEYRYDLETVHNSIMNYVKNDVNPKLKTKDAIIYLKPDDAKSLSEREASGGTLGVLDRAVGRLASDIGNMGQSNMVKM
jgi:hypothetical protein